MAFEVEILKHAEDQITEINDFLEARRKGYGTRFVLILSEELLRIANNPPLFKRNERGFYEATMKTF